MAYLCIVCLDCVDVLAACPCCGDHVCEDCLEGGKCGACRFTTFLCPVTVPVRRRTRLVNRKLLKVARPEFVIPGDATLDWATWPTGEAPQEDEDDQAFAVNNVLHELHTHEQVQVVWRSALSGEVMWCFCVGKHRLPEKLSNLKTGMDLYMHNVVRSDGTMVNAAALSITEFMEKDGVIELQAIQSQSIPRMPRLLSRIVGPRRHDGSFRNGHRKWDREFIRFVQERALVAPDMPGIRSEGSRGWSFHGVLLRKLEVPILQAYVDEFRDTHNHISPMRYRSHEGSVHAVYGFLARAAGLDALPPFEMKLTKRKLSRSAKDFVNAWAACNKSTLDMLESDVMSSGPVKHYP